MPARAAEEATILRAALAGFAAHNAARAMGPPLTWEELSHDRQETLLKVTRRIRQLTTASPVTSLEQVNRVAHHGVAMISGSFVGAVAGFFLDHP